MTSNAGQHKATVVLDGKSDGLNKAAREASTRVGVLEAEVDKLREELGRASQRLDEQTSALERHRQQMRADAEATRQARAEQKEWSAAIKRARAEIATAEKAQADAMKKAKAEVAAAEKAQADAFAHAQRRMQEAGTRTSTGVEQQASAWSRARGALADYTLIAGGAFSAIERGAEVVSALADRSVQVNNVMGNLPFAIDKARAATGGMVKDMELATAASTLMSTGVVDNAKDFADLARAAQALGGRAGIDTARSFESLTAALARGSTEMLDNLGIVLKKEQAEREYADTLGKTREALTDTEKAEAFRKVAMTKIIEAARGIRVDTDSAGAAVQRFEADLDRLQNKALGGAQANVSLRKGLQQVALTYRESGKEVRTYGADADQLRDLLNDLQVGTDELSISNAQLGRELDKIRKEELARIEGLIFQGEATDEHIEQLKFLRTVLGDAALVGQDAVDAAIKRQEEEALAARQARQALDEELRTLQLSIAFLEGKGDEERLLNAALADEVELRAKILELEGKSAEAATLRGDLELKAQRAAGQALRGRSGGGRRRDAEWGLDAVFGDTEAILGRLEAQERRAQASLERTGRGATARFRELHEQLQRDREAMEGLQELSDRINAAAAGGGVLDGMNDPFDLEAYAAVQERAREMEEAANTRDYQRRLRSAEEIDDPIARMEAETNARLLHLDAQRAATFDSLELARVADEREAALHELKLARLAAETTAREEAVARQAAIAERSADVMLGVASVAVRAAAMEGGAVRKAVAAHAKATAIEMLAIQAPAEGIRALIAAASYNYPKAALHVVNMGEALALGAAMAALGAAAGGGGRRPKVPSMGGMQFQGDYGGGGGGGSGGFGGSSEGSSRSQIPVSPSPEPRSKNAAGSGPGNGSTVVNVNVMGDVYGTTRKEFVRSLDRDIRDYGYGYRRVS